MAADLDALDAKISRVMASLHGARAVSTHSPNAETMRIETRTEAALNALLDERYARQIAERMVRA